MKVFCSSVRAVLIVAAVAGCSSSTDQARMIADSNKTNIQRLPNLYMMYQSEHGWKGPKDEATFKAFLRKADPATLSAMGVDPSALDKLFTSERDAKPFKIRYGVAGGMGVSAPVVFEQEGKRGKKAVGFTGMVVEEVDDVRYAELWSGKGGASAGAARGGPPAEAMTDRPTGPPP